VSEPRVADADAAADGLDARDRDHLRTLAVCYFVVAGLSGLGALFSLIYVVIGALMLSGALPELPGQTTGPAPDAKMLGVIGAVMVGVGLALFALLTTKVIFDILTGRALLRRRSLLLCQITAGITCLSVPIGTVLGIFTFIVLARPSVRDAFAADRRPAD